MELSFPYKMNKFIIFFILFSITTSETFGSPVNEEGNKLRQKRSTFDNIQSAALLGFSELTNTFREGMGYKDNTDRELNVFGAKVGGGTNFKTGFGHAVEDDSSEESKRRRRDVLIDSEQIIMDEDDLSEQFGDNDSDRRKRSDESDETFIVVESPEERRKRSALRSYTMNKNSKSDSSSEESFEVTSSEEDAPSPIAMNRKKREAKPCFGMKPRNNGGAGGGADDGGGDTEQLRRANYRRQRGKRQAPTDPGNYVGHSPFDMGDDGEPDEKFQMFMERVMESVKKVAIIAKKVQEAFEAQASEA